MHDDSGDSIGTGSTDDAHGAGDGGDGNGHAGVFAPPVPLVQFGGLFEDLKSSGLTLETLEAADIWIDGLSTAPDVRKRIAGLLHWKRYTAGQLIVFPFFEPGAVWPYTFRFKLAKPRPNPDKPGKSIKYEQPRDTPIAVYFTPRLRMSDAYRDATRPLVWTEGEKKALALEQMGHVVVGLTGVTNWHDKQAKDAGDGHLVHPLIRKHCTIAGRAHLICYDADSKSPDKPDIYRAARRLADALLKAGATSVRFVHPPTLEHKGIDDYYAAFGHDAANALLETHEPIEPLEGRRLAQNAQTCAQLTAAGLDAALRIPEAYEVNDEGVFAVEPAEDDDSDEALARVCRPIFVARVLEDLYTREQRFDVAVLQAGGRWVRCPVPRAVTMNYGIVAALSAFGADVNMNNMKHVVRWLAAFEEFNGAKLPRTVCVQRAGWHHVAGHWQFMADAALTGSDCPPDVPRVELDVPPDQARTFAALAPRAGSSNAEHAAALRDAWNASDDCAVVIAAAFAAPLLRRMGLPNFAVHLCGDSSRGKSSMLKCAASIYGDPREGQDWVTSWNATAAGLEQRAAALSDLPQCFDESGVATPEEVERAVYTLINGTGRTRSNKDLKRSPVASWHTVVLSTGERELASEDAATGAQVRVISLPIDGFGELDGKGVDELRERCCAHAGAIGRQWLTFSADRDADDWELLRTDRDNFLDDWRPQLSGDALAGRIATHFALLAAVECELHEHWQIGDADGATMARAFERLRDGGGMAKPAHERVLDELRDWVNGEPRAFPFTDAAAPRLPSDDKLEPGELDVTASTKDLPVVHGYRLADGFVAFLQTPTRRRLADRQLPLTRAVLGQLRGLKLLRAPQAQRFAARVQINRVRRDFFVIDLEERKAKP